MNLSMREPVYETVQTMNALKDVHRAQLWIDADDEPCMVFVTDISTHLRAALLENGSNARFPIRRAPTGTTITLKQEA